MAGGNIVGSFSMKYPYGRVLFSGFTFRREQSTGDELARIHAAMIPSGARTIVDLTSRTRS